VTEEIKVRESDRPPFAMIPEDLLLDSTIDFGARILWALLQRYVDLPKGARPSVETLALRLSTTDRTIRRWLDALTRGGWLTREKTTTEAGRPSTNLYVLHWKAKRTQMSGRGDTDVSPSPDTDVRRGVTPVSAERELEKESKMKESKSLDASLSSGTEVVALSLKQELAKARDVVSREVLNRWWEGESPRPAQPYIGCLKVVSKMLEVGWSPDDVFFALGEAPVVSTGALTMALKMRRKSSNGTQTQTLLSMMVTLDGMSEEDQERWWNTEGPGRLRHG
jgi:hypothetical protein